MCIPRLDSESFPPHDGYVDPVLYYIMPRGPLSQPPELVESLLRMALESDRFRCFLPEGVGSLLPEHLQACEDQECRFEIDPDFKEAFHAKVRVAPVEIRD